MPDIDTQIRGYACEAVADCHADRIISVRRFPAGENHAVYKLSYLSPTGDTRHLVIRVSLGTHADEWVQAEREARVLAHVRGKYAPQLYDFRRESRWFDRPVSCSEFIEGDARDMTSASAEDVQELGSAVGWLHTLPTDDLAPWLPSRTTMAGYLDSRLENIIGRFPSISEPLPATVQDRLHRTWAALRRRLGGARSADSGHIFSQNELTEEQRIAFWLGYREHPFSERRLTSIAERVRWWEPTTLLGSSLYWVELFSRRAAADEAGRDDPATPRSRSYYLERVTRRLDLLDELLVDPATDDPDTQAGERWE